MSERVDHEKARHRAMVLITDNPVNWEDYNLARWALSLLADNAKLEAGLHPGEMPKFVGRGHKGLWCSDWSKWVAASKTLGQGDIANIAAEDWCAHANRYEALTGKKVDA